MAEGSKRVVVIGGGTGGYVAALRAAQLGASVILVEKNALGGTCLNRGCIPTKVLLHTAELASAAREGEPLGLFVREARVDWSALMRHKEEVVARLVEGVGFLLGANGVEVVQGNAVFRSPGEVAGTQEDGTMRSLSADAFIVATGSVPALPPVPGFDLPGILTSDGVLGLEMLPKSILLVGGGVIGIEFASIFSALGVEVTVVEMLPALLSAGRPVPFMNKDMLLTMMRREGIREITNTSLLEVTDEGAVLVDNHFRTSTVPCDTVVTCTGFKANDQLFKELYGRVEHLYNVGDSQVAADVMTAVWQANEVALNVS